MMRFIPYPQCCGSRTIVEFGNTAIGFGSEPYTKEEVEKFLVDSINKLKNEKSTFLTAVLNTDQSKLFHDVFVDAGFNCFAHNMYHPKYGNSLSFYLYVADYGVNKKYKDLEPQVGLPIVEEDARD